MKKKVVILLPVLVIIAIVFIAAITSNSNRATIKWANELEVANVTKIELVVMPSAENERYMLFEEGNFSKIVNLLNSCEGKYVADPESISGGSSTLYITLANGTIHTVSNNGNVYLVIDGDNYSVSDNWLAAWDECALNRGSAKMPDNFVY